MNIKQILELTIEDSGMNGEGIARFEGKVVFVPYTLKGERVRAIVREVKKKYAVASVIKLLSPSPFRKQPECPHYYKCGGCDTLHLSDEYRKEMLVSELSSNLKKIAGLEFGNIGFTDCPGALRNKLSMPFGLSGGQTVLGLFRQGSHDVEQVDCVMAKPLSRSVAAAVLGFVREKRLTVYDGETGRGLLRHLVLREIGGRISTTLVINGERLPGDCERALGELLPDNADFFICPNTKRGNVILGDGVRLVRGAPRIPVEVLGVKAALSPLSFFQVNDGIRDKLYAAAVSELTAPCVYDLYSGIGITSNLIAKTASRVVAVECVPQATADADETARLNGNSHIIHNVCGDVEKLLPGLTGDGEPDVLVDPPRKGCGAGVMTAIAGIKPRKLVYISCNHATMCRDIRIFLDASSGAYSLDSCNIYNMFPGTHHCETLTALSRR